MGEIGRVTVVQQGYTGAPGYTNLHFFGDPMSPSTAQDAVDDTYAFFNALGAGMGGAWVFSINPDVPIYDVATGALQRIETTTPSAQSVFAGGGAYSAGVGAVVQWTTAAVHLTKRLRGRTFIVPLAGAAYDATGTISSTTLSNYRTAANTLAAVANFGVWGRPVGGSGGVWSAATGASIRDHVAWLSSRRD